MEVGTLIRKLKGKAFTEPTRMGGKGALMRLLESMARKGQERMTPGK